MPDKPGFNRHMQDDPTRADIDGLTNITAGLEKRLDVHDELIGRDGETLRLIVAKGVAEGMRAAVTDPQFWEAARGAMMNQTRQAAGSWLLNGLAKGATLLGWAGLVALGLYLLGGWKLLIGAIASFRA